MRIRSGASLLLTSALAWLYFRGTHRPDLSGTLAHMLGRSHVFFVHLSVGTAFLAPALTLSSLDQERKALFNRFLRLTLLISLITGVTMQLIERYPNPRIQEHAAWGFFACGLLLSLWLLEDAQIRARAVRAILVTTLVLAVLQAARIGGELHKGLGFFHALD